MSNGSGQVIADDEGIFERWKTYSNDLLQEGAQGQENNQDREVQPNEEMGEGMQITVEEVEAAIVKLKNNKSPGVCGISAEMLKAGKMVVVKCLHRIVSLAWDHGEVPDDW